MKKLITKEILARTAELARFVLSEKEEEKMLGELEKILEHFEELKKLDVENVEAMAGGTEEKNVFRGDEAEKNGERENDGVVAAFPENERNFLKVPPVFE